MKSQATRLTPAEMENWDHWSALGYRFKPGEKPPMSKVTPPSVATKRPIVDAALGLLIIIKALALIGFWMYTAADMARAVGHG